MPCVIEVLCEGHTHRLEVRDDGTAHMLDHEEIDVRAFVVFGAKPPGCLEEIDRARDDPVGFLFDHLDINQKTISLLACDFAERVLPIWYEYYPDDHRPRKTIEATRKYVDGKIEKSTFQRARNAAWTASVAAARAVTWSSAVVAVDAARSASWSAAASAAAASAAAGVLAAASAAARAVYDHAEAHGNDPEAARAAEKRWQVGRIVQVVEAISRGEDPWQS